jgi:Subtilase family
MEEKQQVRQQMSWGRRLKWGLGVMSAVLVGVGAPVAGQTAQRAASPVHNEQPDPQAGQPDGSFSGYVGYVGADGAGSAAAPSKPDGRKAESLGPVGTNSTTNEDVPGQPAESAESAETPALSVIPLPSRPDPTQLAEVQSAVGEAGTARVIVMMQAPMRLEADMSAAQVDAQHEAIAESLDGLQATLKGTGSQKLVEYQVVPSAVYEVTADGLAALRANPDVVSVVLDGQVESDLASSTGVIDSDLLNAAGDLGNNFEGNSTGGQYQVAIIDSGVDGGHNAFTGRIVRQACFVTDGSCPGGTNSFVGAPGGEECTHSTDCDHGTHVGGIAAGGFFTGGHEGVARGAGIAAIKVAQDNPASSRWTAFFSSIDSALQHVILLKHGVPEHRHVDHVHCGRPGVQCRRPDHRCAVRSAAGARRGPVRRGREQRLEQLDQLPRLRSERAHRWRHQRRRRAGELHQLERRSGLLGSRRQHRCARADRQQPRQQGRHVDGDAAPRRGDGAHA